MSSYGKMTEKERRILKSSHDFITHIWPHVGSFMGGGIIKLVEGNNDNNYNKNLDTLAGIDMWQILPENKGMRSIASRVQYKNDKWTIKYPPNTFTIRYELASGLDTEIDKRIYAIRNEDQGIAYPAFTIHSYLSYNGPPLFSAAWIKTKDLFEASEKYRNVWIILPVEGGNKMQVLHWTKLECLGYKVTRWEPIMQMNLPL